MQMERKKAGVPKEYQTAARASRLHRFVGQTCAATVWSEPRGVAAALRLEAEEEVEAEAEVKAEEG